MTAGLTRLRTRLAWAMVAATLLLSFLLVQTPQLAPLLHLAPLDADDWALALGGAVVAAILARLSSRQRGQGRRIHAG
jgi:hypothetical protein